MLALGDFGHCSACIDIAARISPRTGRRSASIHASPVGRAHACVGRAHRPPIAALTLKVPETKARPARCDDASCHAADQPRLFCRECRFRFQRGRSDVFGGELRTWRALHPVTT